MLSRRRDRSRGAALLEAAVILPLLLTLVFGILEFGYAFKTRLTIGNMSVSGARAGSGFGADVTSDFSILAAVRHAAAGMPDSQIDVVVVYRASGPGDRVPNACLSTSVTNTASTRGCNRYVGSDLGRPESDFGCVNAFGAEVQVDRFWCPTDRKIALTGANGPPDYIGVYVKGRHDTFSGMFGDTYTFTRDTVIRIEPRSLR